MVSDDWLVGGWPTVTVMVGAEMFEPAPSVTLVAPETVIALVADSTPTTVTAWPVTVIAADVKTLVSVFVTFPLLLLITAFTIAFTIPETVVFPVLLKCTLLADTVPPISRVAAVIVAELPAIT